LRRDVSAAPAGIPESMRADGEQVVAGQASDIVRSEAESPAFGREGHSPARAGEPASEVAGRPAPSAARLAELSSRLTPSAQSAARPPVLASEALRKELAPAAPASQQVGLLTAAVGSVGLCAAWLVCGPHGLGVPLGGAFLALAVLGLVPIAYQARAAALVTVAGSGLTVVTWQKLERAARLEPLLLMIAVTLLAMALLFRSWHRASLLARALVALGVALCTGWLWMSGSLQQLLILESPFQAWLPPVLGIPLAALLLLSLLAFMDSRSTGSCGAWAALLLAWYALYSWTELLGLYWPAQAGGIDLSRVPAEVAITALSAPLFATALAMGLAQLLAVATATATESESSG
jgi:hypothetical protein